ncbi:hypothetical protein M378DRAFT_66084 [Amanita muscaria Koide BX008]|uniref:Uncharacterized protein n=1 Tax=Amanita muscaria (strain Koide BX008) TaxID=946122 RepID=A0A0C2XN43_AMAMK|nr:hypothetical protein M378DRAFT_66084 [Amanita muscaria Koide BX008]
MTSRRVADVLESANMQHGRLDGETRRDGKEALKHDPRESSVSQPKAGGAGVSLTAVQWVSCRPLLVRGCHGLAIPQSAAGF